VPTSERCSSKPQAYLHHVLPSACGDGLHGGGLAAECSSGRYYWGDSFAAEEADKSMGHPRTMHKLGAIGA
jgi:hypothetical protein